MTSHDPRLPEMEVNQDLLRERYRSGAVPPAEPWSEALSLMLGHRSIRAFTDEPIEDAAIRLAVAAAQSASNAQNIQPWSVVAVRDPERIARLARSSLGQGFVATTPLYLAWVLDLSRLASSMEALGRDAAPLAGLDPLLVGAIDTALAAQNAALYFESLGLGIVFIGAIRYTPAIIAAELGLGPHMLPLFGMCVGWPAQSGAAEIKPRLPQDAVLHFEQFTPPPSELLANYNNDLSAFRLESSQEMVNWTTYSTERFLRLQDRVRRDDIDGEIRNMGFGRILQYEQ